MADHRSVAVATRPALRLLPPAMPAATGDVAADQTLRPAAAARDVAPQAPVAPRGVRFIPTEDVLLLNVALPKMAPAQRRSAVVFAIEDLIAQPLDQVHVVLGPEGREAGKTGSWLVAVISNSVMKDRVAENAADTSVMLPDVLALPVPAAGEWSVLALDNRILVRLPDRSGFATTPEMLPVLWVAGGSPKVVLLGGSLPEMVPVGAHGPLAPTAETLALGFDLRSGRFARRGASWPQGARAIALLGALAVVGHLTLLAVDVFGLERIASAQAEALRTALDTKGVSSAGDVDAALAAALAAQQPAQASDFLALLAQTFGAMAGQTGQVQIKNLRFSRAGDSLTLTLEAPDLAALQQADTALTDAGLQVDAGAATTGNGGAEVQMALRRVAP